MYEQNSSLKYGKAGLNIFKTITWYFKTFGQNTEKPKYQKIQSTLCRALITDIYNTQKPFHLTNSRTGTTVIAWYSIRTYLHTIHQMEACNGKVPYISTSPIYIWIVIQVIWDRNTFMGNNFTKIIMQCNLMLPVPQYHSPNRLDCQHNCIISDSDR